MTAVSLPKPVTSTRAKRRVKPRGRRLAGTHGEELNTETRALLGEDTPTRAVRPQAYDASMQDPLQDWPED